MAPVQGFFNWANIELTEIILYTHRNESYYGVKNDEILMKKGFSNGDSTHQMVKKQLKIGIISDTHDNLPLVDKAVKRLNQEEVDLVLHAGDYVAPFTVLRFKQLKARLIGVFGNNDGDHEYLKKRFADVQEAEIRGNFAEVIIDGLKIALLHDEGELFHSLVNGQCYDVVVHGHTHEARVYKKGKTIVINPGEVCGYLSKRSTMALLDTETQEARLIEL